MNASGADAGQEPAADRQVAANNPEKTMTDELVPINQRFSSLDEYLAHLERTQGPVDGPWYKQVGPGIYELQTGNLRILGTDGEEPQVKRTFTRDELKRKFGFSE